MGKVEQSNFKIEVFQVIAVIAALLSGCATSARNLPEDYSSIDAKQRIHLQAFDVKTSDLSCMQIEVELKLLESETALQAHNISAKRKQNEAISYVGVLFFLPVLLVTDSNTEANEKIESISKAKDELYKLQAFKKCPST